MFGIIFDGWSDGSGAHLVAIFASYMSQDSVMTPLLACAPLLDEESFTAFDYKEYFESTLKCYGAHRNVENSVQFLTVDNCAVNKLLGRICEKPLVGCASHRLNLASKYFLNTHGMRLFKLTCYLFQLFSFVLQISEVLISKVYDCMKKLRTLKNSAKLRKLCKFRPILPVVTRWLSTYNMLARYMKLHPYLSDVGNRWERAVAIKVLSVEEFQTVEALLNSMKQFRYFSLELQRSDVDMTDTRDLLDCIIASNPGIELYIGPRAPIVYSTDFEAGVIKIQRKADHDLSDAEKNAVKCFLKPSVHRNHNETTTSSGEDAVETLEALRKRRRIENHTSLYADVKHVLPTSNICERLFSRAKLTYSALRKNMLPVHLEEVLYLLVNKHLWNERVIEKVLVRERLRRNSTAPSIQALHSSSNAHTVNAPVQDSELPGNLSEISRERA